MTTRRRLLGLVLAGFAVVALARTAAAADKVQVAWLVVYASNESTEMDRRLQSFKASLDALRFTGFEVLSEGRASMGSGQTQVVPLAEGRSIEVTVSSWDEQHARLQVRLLGGGAVTSTQLTIKRNGTVLFAGIKHREGRLVVPIRVRY